MKVREPVSSACLEMCVLIHYDEGYTANPFTTTESRTWREVFKGGPWTPEAQNVFSPEVEQLNGRAAMVGCASLILVETFLGHALF